MKHWLLSLSFLLIGFIGSSQTTKNTITFDHVALSVSEVDASVAFYEKTFLLKEITNRTEKPGIRWMSLGEGKELHLISVVKEPIKLNKAVHFALTVGNFDEFLNRLKSQNIPYLSWNGEKQKVTVRADGIRQVYVVDPDGYWIEVNSQFPIKR